MARKSKAAMAEEAASFLSNFLKEAGMEVDQETVDSSFADNRYKPAEAADTPMLQAEGVLLYLQNAARNFMPKKCQWQGCGQIFSTQYINVAYCSSLCRGKAMESRGIRWDYSKDHYRLMDADRPLIVGPQAYQVLVEMAHRILENHDYLQQETPSPDDSEQSESDEDTSPNQSVPDTTPVVSPPQLDHPSSSGDFLGFGPAPF